MHPTRTTQSVTKPYDFIEKAILNRGRGKIRKAGIWARPMEVVPDGDTNLHREGRY